MVGIVTELNDAIEETSSYLDVYREKVKNGVKLTPENMKLIKQYNAKLDELNAQRGDKNERLLEIREELNKGKQGSVKVLGNVYRGVTLFIASCIHIVKDKEVHGLYKIVDGEVKPTAF